LGKVIAQLVILPRQIVVPIDERHFSQDAIDARGDGVGLRDSGNGKKKGEDDGGKSMHAAIVTTVMIRQ
jgi:hypothetical protein